MRWAVQNCKRALLSSRILFLHNSAEILAKFKWEVFKHPTYSLDLSPSGYPLFWKLNEFLGGKHFVSDEDLQWVVTTFLTELAVEEYDMGVNKLIDWYEKCLSIEGDDVEK